MITILFLDPSDRLNRYEVEAQIDQLDRALIDQAYGAGQWLALPSSDCPESLDDYTLIDGQLTAR